MPTLPSNTTPSRYSNQIRTIGVVAFPGVQMLDITGPLEVFSFSNYVLNQQSISSRQVYPVKVIAEKSCAVTTMSGLKLVADSIYADSYGGIDTLLIPGGSDVDTSPNDKLLLDWILDISLMLRRLASICTGAFLLAENGLLNGQRAITHWDFCQRLANDYPLINVEPDKISVRDDFISTSGGITSGIDLALAMVEEDWGRELALSVARYLVVFLKRPGGQSQFSAFLTNEATDDYGLRTLQVWIMENPKQDLRVDSLAQRVSMSPRYFARVFLSETGMTVAKYVEMVRIDAVRSYLVNTSLPIQTISKESGFKDSETMRRAFMRNLGVNPRNYRASFSATDTNQIKVTDKNKSINSDHTSDSSDLSSLLQ